MIKIRWAWFVAALLFFVYMVILGSLPGNAQALTEKINDKTLHFIAYSSLTILIYFSVITTKIKKFSITLIIILIFSITDELIQSTLSYRNASLLDLSFDILAACVMTSCLSALKFSDNKMT
jgi:VanZ family protein